jgi:hypothetical protein
MAIRRFWAVRKRARTGDIWPIYPGSEQPPPGWPGWPEGRQFAFVLTHDVEGPEGVARVRALAELEMSLGFRSAFNFIPEGTYRVPAELRAWLTSRGFEVGVHDLRHDGHLFRCRRDFVRHAARINAYLRDWGAVGFRSGFMLHQLDWLHDLQIQYDASTFDTDPFEPQPFGRHTLFPFWVPAENSPAPTSDARKTSAATGEQSPSPGIASASPPLARPGYLELPYTLPQDSTLFLLFRERTPALWWRKLDWIAQHGGMALVNVHPDYLQFPDQPATARTFPVDHYTALLRHVRDRHAGRYWHALPREVAQWAISSGLAPKKSGPRITPLVMKSKPKIWIDLDNTPHVPFFEPILEALQAEGLPVLVTARDAFQVCDLAAKKGLPCRTVGRHYGRHRLLKGAGLVYRAGQLAPLVLREKPALAVSHGARSQLILANLLRLPSLLIEDYEYCQFPALMKPTWLMAPEVIPNDALGFPAPRIRKYPGIKEDVYAWKLKPDFAPLAQLGVQPDDLVVTVRPPATEAHYHNPESEKLFAAFMHRACRDPRVRVVLLPRNQKQGNFIRQHWPAWFQNHQTLIPQAALDGLNLIWHSDLVVSGGGTMNREAAALGVPVYSIFRGTIGAVDRHLCATGRLTLVESLAEVEQKIPLIKRLRQSLEETTSRRTLNYLVRTIIELAESSARG